MLATINQLRAARLLAQVDMRTVGKSLGMSYANIGNIETGSVSPRMETLVALQNFYTSKGVEFQEGGWVRLNPAVEAAQEEKLRQRLLEARAKKTTRKVKDA